MNESGYQGTAQEFLHQNIGASNQDQIQEVVQLNKGVQRMLIVTPPYVNPCLSYADNSTKQVCTKCIANYTLFIRNYTTVLCAYSNLTKVDPASGLYICSLLSKDYPNETSFINFTVTNATQLGPILHYPSPNETAYKSYCMNTNMYYLRTKTYNCPGQANMAYSSYCSQMTSSAAVTSQFYTALYTTMTIRCYQCEINNSLDPISSFRLWPQFGIYSGDCMAQVDTETCTTPPPVGPPKPPPPKCNFNQFLNTTSGLCVDCQKAYSQCAACNSKNCTFCYQNYMWMNNSTYLYNPAGRVSKCTISTCDVGSCQNNNINQCEVAQSNMANCLMCYSNYGQQFCQLCKRGYTLSVDKTQCLELSNQTVNLVYFVNATNGLIYKNYKTPTSKAAPPACQSYVQNTSLINPENITTAAPMLQYALRQIYQMEDLYQQITATIYLSKGNHFFFTCSGNELSSFYTTKSGLLTIYRYCVEYDLYRYTYSANDNFNITIQALECWMGPQLGLQNDPSFLSLCVDLTTDPKPVVYVNNAYTYFNITGSLTVKNLKFSGINALAASNSTDTDLSVYPQLYCSQQQPNWKTISTFQAQNLSTCFGNITYYVYTCIDQFSTNLVFPPTESEAQNCSQQFNTTQQSTLTCYGEPTNRYFFTLSSDGNNLYYARRKTLFNIYSFAEHTTIRNATPELNIDNCDFEYFLASGYESLITIETYSLSSVQAQQTQVTAASTFFNISETYYVYNGGDRGAKIWIENSTFQHSRFCKGMIVYREAFYNGASSALLNLTNLYMTNPIKNNSDSYIVIKQSTFTDMNAFSQVTALAITGNKQLISNLKTYGLDDDVNLPLFVNKGIILNVQDFGGRIEIVGSTFSKNFHYIPGILYKGDSEASLSIQTFADTLTTLELQIMICDMSSLTYTYLFGGSSDLTQASGIDLDTIFDQYERLGLIYISRNKDLVLIKDSEFDANIGTFGGAITINSPNWMKGNQPHVVIHNNLFQNNMAYFSGNAIYIRNTLIYNDLTQQTNCGGVNIINNNFINNIGMKIHNGGAVSAYCYYITDLGHQDVSATSNFTSTTLQVSYQYPANSSVIIVNSIADTSELTIQKVIFNIEGNYFNENYSGGKGTAIYVRQMSNIKIYANIFTENGPVYAVAEYLYSPYTLYISGRSMTYYDDNCIDEYSYLAYCFQSYDITSAGGVQWSVVQGALFIAFCQDAQCLNSNATQILNVIESGFARNLAGPALDSTFTNTASQIFIQGGLQVLITGCQFFENQGSELIFSNLNGVSLTHYFPPTYFTYSMSPLINIILTPPTKVSYVMTMNFTIQASNFYENRNIQILGLSSTLEYWGSLIQMQNLAYNTPQNEQILLLTVEDCHFNDNLFTGENSALIYTYQILTQVLRSTFINNGRITNQVYSNQKKNNANYVQSPNFIFLDYNFNDYQSYGCIWVQSVTVYQQQLTHLFINNTFKYNFANQGVAYSFFILDNQQVLIQGNTYQFMFAMTQGGILYWEQNTQQASIMMKRENASYIFAQQYGALRITPIQHNNYNLLVYNSSFSDTYASQGSGIALSYAAKVVLSGANFTQPSILQNLTNITLQQFKMTSVPLLKYYISLDLLLAMTSNITQTSGFVDLEYVTNNMITPLIFNGTLIQNNSNQYRQFAELINSNFIGSQAIQYAAVYGYNSMIRVKNYVDRNGSNSFFIANNSVQSNGAIGVEGASIFVGENLQFINNTAATTCSALYLSQSSGNLSNSIFALNTASQSGTVIIEGNSVFNFNRSSFISNKASDSSVLFAQNNRNGLVTFSYSTFINNTSGMNLISFLYSHAQFNHSTFIDNIAQSVNHGITLISASAYMLNVTVNYTDPVFLSTDNSDVDTGFLNLNYQSSIVISNSSFLNCRGSLAGVIYVTGKSSIVLQNHTSILYSQSANGHAIVASLAQTIVVDRVIFYENSQSDISLQQTSGNISNSMFINSGSSSVQVLSSSINLVNNTFQDDAMDYSVQDGKALYCQCQGQSLIVNNTFTGLSSVRGGALFLLTSSRTTQQIFIIDGNKFLMNSAQQGGAIYLQDAMTANFTRNLFDSNTAVDIDSNNFANKLTPSVGEAGAIYYSCEINTPVDSSNDYISTCTVYITNGNKFSNNSADNGGAILWVSSKPVIDSSNTFKFNNASYGIDIGSYPGQIQLQFISNNDYVNPYDESNSSIPQDSNGLYNSNYRVLQENSIGNVPPLVSGNTIDFNIYIYDQDDNIYRSDSSSKAVLETSNSKLLNVILLNNQAIANQGVYYFRNVEFIAPPSSQASLQISISGLSVFGNSVGFINSPVQLNVTTRACVAGEQQTAENQCIVCPAGTFQYLTPNSTIPCQSCPKNAICGGKTNVSPLPGYWRSSNESVNIDSCPNADACLGGNDQYPQGECAIGYQGILCGDCQPYYSQTKQFTCAQCPPVKQNVIQMIFILLVVVFVVSFLVKSTLDSADKRKPAYSVYLKIMTNHFQILSGISNINYDWPQEIQNFQNKQNSVSSSSDQIFSVDCFLMGPDQTSNGVPIFYQKLIMFGFLPLILLALCLIAWFIIGRIQLKTLKEVWSKYISTIIVVLFLVHPNIAKQIFMTFNCYEVDGVYRMKQDLESICYQGQHLKYVLLVALPSLVLWVVGIPLFALFLLVKNKRILNLMAKKEITQNDSQSITNLKMKYGFLFAGYNAKTFYWEVTLMFRKVFVIASSVFLSSVSVEAQVLVVIFIIVLSMFMHMQLDPYYNKTLNTMESYSLQVAAVTVYLGMYYINGESYMNIQAVSWTFLLLILFSNGVFIAYWLYHMRLEILKEMHRRKLHPMLLKLVMCQSPERFYDLHMRMEDESIKANEQTIIEEKPLDESGVTESRIRINDELVNTNSLDEIYVRSPKKQTDGHSSFRSFKVFPESVINTDREYNRESRMNYSPQNSHFKFNDGTIRNKVEQNKRKRAEKNRSRFGFNLETEMGPTEEKKSTNQVISQKKRIRQKQAIKDSESEIVRRTRNNIEEDYTANEIDIDSVQFSMQTQEQLTFHRQSANNMDAFAFTLKKQLSRQPSERSVNNEIHVQRDRLNNTLQKMYQSDHVVSDDESIFVGRRRNGDLRNALSNSPRQRLNSVQLSTEGNLNQEGVTKGKGYRKAMI